MTGEMPWRMSHRFDREALPIADRHYNRQKPGTPQFVPPGRNLVLLADGPALWTSSWPFAEFTKHRWAGAWVNTLFRREGGPLASTLIRAAVAATRWHWPDVPALGMVTFVNASMVKSINPGCCYLRAGFERDGETKGGLLAFRLAPEQMPDAIAPYGAQLKMGAAS